MREMLYVVVVATLVCLAHAEVGAECEDNEGCAQLTEFCNKTRVCRWRLAGGWFPYFGCAPDGECALKQGFNQTCRFDDDCASGHCRWMHCVSCGNDSHCGAQTYCDQGFLRAHEPPLMKIKKHHEEGDGEWWKWWEWGDDDHEELDDAGEFYGERFGRHDRHEREDREDALEGAHMRWWRRNKERNHRLKGKLDDLYDEESGMWLKFVGTIAVHPTWQCLAKKASGNLCISDSECVSNTCDGGKCVASTARQCTWDREAHTSVGCAPDFICHGGWDPLVPNICAQFTNCTQDSECAAQGRFCDVEHGKCVQCNHHNYTVCGNSNYCYYGMCRPRMVSGYCDRWWMCQSGQCRGWTQECARVTTFSGKKK